VPPPMCHGRRLLSVVALAHRADTLLAEEKRLREEEIETEREGGREKKEEATGGGK
jgi:hypothetical protein